jgi:hypothetical protein
VWAVLIPHPLLGNVTIGSHARRTTIGSEMGKRRRLLHADGQLPEKRCFGIQPLEDHLELVGRGVGERGVEPLLGRRPIDARVNLRRQRDMWGEGRKVEVGEASRHGIVDEVSECLGNGRLGWRHQPKG